MIRNLERVVKGFGGKIEAMKQNGKSPQHLYGTSTE
jgi:hypothetical protein